MVVQEIPKDRAWKDMTRNEKIRMIAVNAFMLSLFLVIIWFATPAIGKGGPVMVIPP